MLWMSECRYQLLIFGIFALSGCFPVGNVDPAFHPGILNHPPTSGSISFSNISPTSMRVHWEASTDTTPGDLQYKLILAQDETSLATLDLAESGANTTVVDYSANVFSADLTGLSSGSTYYFTVIAKDAGNQKSLYPVVGQVTLPATPTRLIALEGGGLNAIEWNAVMGADSYKIYWDTSAGVSTSDSSLTSSTAGYTHAGVTDGTTYYYRVAAVNAAGESSLSNEATSVDPDNHFQPGFDQISRARKGKRSTDQSGFGAGFTTTTFLGVSDGARAVAVQHGGDVIAVGFADNGTDHDMALLRYTPGGYLDTSFHTDGKRTLSPGSRQDYLHSVAVQTDGRIVAVGRSTFTNTDFVLLRFLSGGELDSSFHIDGIAAHSMGSYLDAARAVILQSDGKSIVSGYSWSGSELAFVVARFLTDGSFDPTFNQTGFRTIALSTEGSGALAVALTPQQKILVSGPAKDSGVWQFGVARLSTDGTLDTGFFTNGYRLLQLAGVEDRALSVDVGENDAIAVGGSSHDGTSDNWGIARLLSNGSLDTAFHTDGIYTRDFGGNLTDRLTVVRFQSTGSILAGGLSENGVNKGFSLIAVTIGGGLDTSFSTDGIAIPNFSGSADKIQSIVQLADSSFFVAGQMDNGTDPAFGVARFAENGEIGIPGQLDASFGTQGQMQFGGAGGGTGFSDSAGRIVRGNSGEVFRLLPNGSLDTSFATDGSQAGVIAVHHGGEESNGKLYFGGESGHFQATRLCSDGRLDTSFHTDGLSQSGMAAVWTSVCYGIVLQTDGKYACSGFVGNAGLGMDTGYARWNSDGTLDTSFGTDGTIVHDQGAPINYNWDMALQTDGKVIGAGYLNSGGGGRFQRLLTSGALEGGFPIAELDAWGFLGVDIAPIGNVLFGGVDAAVVDAALVRYTDAGDLDTSFHTDGKIITDNGGGADIIYSVKHQKKGQILAAGSSDTDLSILRYLSDGTLDTSFHTTGKVKNGFWNLVGGVVDVFSNQKTGKICATASIDGGDAAACFWP